MRLLKKLAKLFNLSSNKLKRGDFIPPESYLLRRVFFKDKKHLKPDGTLSSRAFTPRPKKDDGKLSVNLEEYTIDLNEAIQDLEKFRFYKFKANDAYQIGLNCVYDPIEKSDSQDANLAHSYVEGFAENDESRAAILARVAVRVPFPD